MTSMEALHASLLRPAVIHILRASGFHSTRPSVIDTLTDLAARYLLIVASRTAEHAQDRTIASIIDIPPQQESETEVSSEELYPTVTDVRLGLTDAAFFTPTMTASEEAWAETMRKPLSAYPAGARDKERRRRDAEDTRDIREFVDWAVGPAAREIRRIAGLLHEDITGSAIAPATAPTQPHVEKEDYLAALKKKNHTGKNDGLRYAGTLLGDNVNDSRVMRIEGGPPNFGEWMQGLKRKREDTAI